MKTKMINNINVVKSGEAAFPALLKEIKGCPKQLYYVGDLKLLHKRCVSVVGSRTCTTYGRVTAEKIASTLAQRDVTVVSGMARGIDSSAHKGALAVYGSTAAVFGCGPDICYPPENEVLMNEIMKRGIIVSEYPPGVFPDRFNFPSRNRIISGLSEMTIVVQARNKSGSLITAELAIEQGRDVYAVPGNIDSQHNLGNNKLIKEGAVPIISIDDILSPLGIKDIDESLAREKLSPLEFEVFNVIREYGEMSVDEISYKVGKSPEYITPVLSVIEMKGFIFSELGKFFLANF